jgi:hypothetical protein
MHFRLPLPGSAALLLAACSPALDWREVRPEASGVVALFPCKPASHARSVTLAGAPVRLTLVACNAAGATWAIAYTDVVDPARVGPALKELREAAASNLGAASEATMAWQLGGATPHPQSGRFEMNGHLPDGKPMREQLALFARGTTVVQATALGERLDADSLETFFTGLRLAQ